MEDAVVMASPTEEMEHAMAELLTGRKFTREEFVEYRAEKEKAAQEAEVQAQARAVARDAERENDPRYWKGLYLGMVQREERRKQEREALIGLLTLSVIVGGVLFVLKYVLHWL